MAYLFLAKYHVLSACLVCGIERFNLDTGELPNCLANVQYLNNDMCKFCKFKIGCMPITFNPLSSDI